MTASDWRDFAILFVALAPLMYLCARIFRKLRIVGKTGDQVPSEAAAKWGVVPALLIIVAGYFLFAYLLTPVVFGILYSLLFSDTSASIDAWVKLTYVNFSYALAVSLLQLSLVFWYVSRRGGSLRALGLTPFKHSYIVKALVAYGIYFVLYVVIYAAISNFIPAINTEQQQDIGFESAMGFEMVLAFISLVILPPFAEEVLMRGFLYGSLKKRLPHMAAIILTSLLFAAAHLQLGSGSAPLWIAAVDTFVLSVVLIKLTDRSKSLWPAIIVHMIKNCIAFVTLFILS